MKTARALVSAGVERSRKVYGILYSSLPDDLRAQVAHIAQGWAYGLWEWLEKKFQSTEEDNVGALLAQWTVLQQEEEESFDAYRARVNRLYALLEQAKEKQSARMFSFMLLDRLQPRYKQAVLALKASGQLKDADTIEWESVTSFLNAHERNEQRLGITGDWGSEGPSAAKGGLADKVMAAHRRIMNHTAGRQSPSVAGDKHQRMNNLKDVQCYNCEGYGHFRRSCPQPRRTTTSSQQGRARAAASGSKHHRTAESTGSRRLQQLAASAPTRSNNPFHTLNQPEEADGEMNEDGTECAVKKGSAHAAVANCSQFSYAAILIGAHERERALKVDDTKVTTSVHPPKPLASKRIHTRQTWGVDSMASLHISGQRSLFHTFRACQPVSVQMANGEVVTAEHRGSISLRVHTTVGKAIRIVVDDVYYHERFAANLLGWDGLRRKGWELHSTSNGTYVITPGKKEIKLCTKERVSVMESINSLEQTSQAQVYGARELNISSADDLIRQHQRLGHVGLDRLIHFLRSVATDDIGKLSIPDQEMSVARRRILECKACALAKGTRTAFGHRGLDKGSAPGETLHMDTFYVNTTAPDGARLVEYGLTVIDPYTEWRWHTNIDRKDEIAAEVIKIVRHAQTQFDCKVKRLYADGGTEFINHTLKSFCEKEGIELRYPPARTQQLNGIAERAVRSGKEMARSMLIHSGAPMKFWRYAMLHMAYVWNRTHIARATGVTPYEAMYKKKPSAYHLGVFGCDSFSLIPKELRGSVTGAKMEPCIYLGHDARQNCARILVLSKMKLLFSRDVIYRESRFTHAEALGIGEERVQHVIEDGYIEQPHMESLFTGQQSESKARPQGGRSTATGPVPASAEGLAAANPAEADQNQEYDVERILGKRVRNGCMEYHVKWVGYEEKDATWEPASFVEGARELVEEYEAAAHPCLVTRRSPRFQEAKQDDTGVDAPARPQVHMAMCALRNLQCGSERVSQVDSTVVYAVNAGVGLLEQETPTTYRGALTSPDAPKWRDAMDKEMEACEKLKVWELVPRKELPATANILPVKWVYKIKTNEDGTVTQYKARLTPKGFRQKEGVDYFEVFARTGMYKSMRAGLSLAAKWDHEVDQLDVPTAFLNADVEEEVWMEVPNGYHEGKEHLVCKLNKSLYGLKQAPRNWYLLFSKFIVESLGLKASISDPCLFYRRSRTGRLMLLFLFVDDCQVSYHMEDKAEWEELKAKLVARFQTKDMGPSKWILGMKITRDKKARTIILDQELYVTKALEKYGLDQCKVASTPEVIGAQHDNNPDLDVSTDRQRFMEITGTLMYAAISTRPDISHAVHYLASNMLAPTKRHMTAAERVLRYLAGTKKVGLVFGSRNGPEVGDSRGHSRQLIDVCAYADADWANDKGDRKSVSGWVGKLNGDPISWSSKKQRTVALSTCEAELYAEAAAIQEVLWLRGLIKELGLKTQMGSVVHGDNQSAIAVSKNGIKGERTKHVDVKYHFITETIEHGSVKLKWVPTSEQQADIFTKALAQPVFEHFRKQLMTC